MENSIVRFIPSLPRVAVCVAILLMLGGTAFGSPYFLVGSEAEWQGAMTAGKVYPMPESQWSDYMLQWGSHLAEGSPYPENEFVPAYPPSGQLYVSPGGYAGYPSDAGLVMVWQPRQPLQSGSFSSAWKYDYGLDPNLNNCTITVTVTPPQFGMSGQINTVSFGIQDVNGFIRAWHWNCGPGGLPWNVPTTITINTALVGLGAANPAATGYASNPLFNLATSQFFIADENCQWVGGPVPTPPPPGQFPGIWNYWHNIMVTPNIPPKGTDPTKWSQPVVEISGYQPPLFNGWDEWSMYYQRPICADDWKCTDTRPVTDIHWWGSFINWDQPTPPQLPNAFHIGIWTDVPASATNPFSHPGTLIWENYCTSYVWNFAGYDKDPRGIYQNEACFQFNQWLQPDEYFYQQPNPLTGYNIYWLSIAAMYTGTPQYPWGWKTRPHYFQDDGVRITQVTSASGGNIWPPTLGSTWAAGSAIEYPTGVTWDLAFELTTNQQAEIDWGDAPDPTYPTLSPLGASHVIVPGFFLGALIDAEADGQPNTNATGDDISVSDDEDGVVWTSILTPGGTATIEVTASATGMLDAWLDYNRDGDWADPGEQIFASPVILAGVNYLSFVVPPGASEGTTFARFRFSTAGGLSYTGPASDGEVEDYEVAIACYKWIQKPDLTTMGIDVDATQDYILADDYQCTEPGPVTDIHIWGSWLDDRLPQNDPNQVAFTLSIHEDIPKGPAGEYSRPGRVLWSRTFQPGQFQVQAYRRNIEEGWMTPPENYFFPADTVCWQYNFYLNPSEFCQTGTETAPVTYWLDVQARPMSTDARFGWKTSLEHWNDDAVWGHGQEPYPGPWNELRYPPNHELYWQSIDLAFAITGCCPDKYTQPPDTTTRGFDVNATYPYLVADDFPCEQTGPISGITVWASWKDDIVPTGGPGQASFTVSLYRDIPAVPPNAYSRPGEVLWSRTYNPGQFQWKTYARQLQEGWLTPPTNYVFPGDTVAYQYDFPLQPGEFTQHGTPTQPQVYWVGVQAQVQGGAASSCILPDNGTGTADLPPVGCEYPTPYDDMRIVNGLKPGDTIEIDATHKDFVCLSPNDVCSFPLEAGCRQPGGSLGGEEECFTSQLMMPMVGTGSLAGFSRNISLPVSFEVHTAPRTLGDPVQSFDTVMFRLFGQITGDPDFDLLRVTAGTDFGMPSPGHTTLTQQGTNWAVDSFFDITYRIDFIGAPSGPLGGMSGSTTGTIRMQTGGGQSGAQFGVKTSYKHWNDDSVWGQGLAPLPTITPWGELRYPPGHPQYPESCDLAFQIQTDCPCEQLDWGDAPDPTYPTLAASVPPGASHVIVPGMFLGALIDAEPDGQPTPIADGDDINGVDDEDGVVFTTPLVPGAPASVTVTASVAGMLDAWIDFNADGDWADSGEQIAISLPLVAGLNVIGFTVPAGAGVAGAFTTSFSRFRYSSAGGLSYTGPALDGEVEDYMVSIYPRPVIVTKADAKCLTLGSYVLIKKDVVTANFGSIWYFEEPTRFAALGVVRQPNAPWGPWSPGDLVSCYGYTALVDCELVMMELYSWSEGQGRVDPLGQNNRDSGGGRFCNQPGLFDRVLSPLGPQRPAFGLNSVAMLVKLWGRCTCVDAQPGGGGAQSNFWIDDGSRLWDGTRCYQDEPTLGVRVRVPDGYGGPPIYRGGYYLVTGIMRTTNATTIAGECVRWLWPRMDSDIQLVDELPQ